jgi:hypothetical protein
MTVFIESKFHVLSTVGIKVEAPSFVSKFKRTPTLGDCTLGSHRYRGDVVHTPFPNVEYKYSRKSDRLRSNIYRDIIGGIGFSAFGLFGASAKVRVASSVKRDKKSIMIYSHFKLHKGMISLANAEIGTNWKICTKVGKHYYLRDILTGMEDYLLVQLQFRSEAKRREIEVTVKVKFLFFSATKTIRKIKKDFTSDFSLSVYRVSTFPTRKEETLKFGSDVGNGLNYIDAIEKGRVTVLNDLKAAKFDDQRLHLDYFFQPCMIRTIVDSLPFKPAFDFVLIEFIERAEEMESVLLDVQNIKPKSTAAQRVELEKLESQLQQRLNKIGDWRNQKLSHLRVKQLLAFYGVDRAPYYYERQLNVILSK